MEEIDFINKNIGEFKGFVSVDDIKLPIFSSGQGMVILGYFDVWDKLDKYVKKNPEYKYTIFH